MLDVGNHPEKLRCRLVQVNSAQHDARFTDAETDLETLLHVIHPLSGRAELLERGMADIELKSWNTIAISPGEHISVRLASGSSLLALIVRA